MFENEGSPESVTESTESTQIESPVESEPPTQAPTLDRQAEKTVETKPEPESLRSKMEKQMAKAKARDEAAGIKKAAAQEAKIDPETPPTDPKAAVIAPKVGETPALGEPKYEPNFKFKFTDGTQKQQEKEFPDWAKAGIKDPESEKEIRSVFEKAHGLDFVLPRFKAAREELEAVKPRLTNFETNITTMKDMYQKGNMAGIFEKLGIAEEKVLQYAVERAKFYQLPPEQQSQIQAQQDAERKAQFAEQNAMDAEGRYEEQARQIKQLQLTTVLQRPDVSQAAKSFDERVGKPGAFFEQVKLHGETTWYRTGGKVDLTPEQAITQVMEQYGLTGAQAAAVMGTPAPTTPAAPAAAASAPPPAAPAPTVKVIPNVGSRAQSPAAGKTKPRSIEDLRKLSKEMSGH